MFTGSLDDLQIRVLRTFPVGTVAAVAGWNADQALELQRYRDELVDFMARMTFPHT